MEQGQHTPGPWAIERVRNEHQSDAGDARTHPRVVGWRCSMALYEQSTEEQEANARLIAQAPTLLAQRDAAVELLAAWERYMSSHLVIGKNGAANAEVASMIESTRDLLTFLK